MIDNCPICGSKLIRKEAEADYYCPNENCNARRVENIIHFAERGAMNIDGLGEAVIEDLFNQGFINNICDIYHIDKYSDELILLEGYGPKSVDNLKKAIEKSKENSLELLISGLGIRQVGNKTAKILAKQFKSLDNLMNADFDMLNSINDVGPIIANNIIDYFKDEKNISIINELKELGINTLYIKDSREVDKEEFLNRTFVLTGTLASINRDDASSLIESFGGKVSSSVSNKTSVVIAGDNPGSKYDKAIKLNITIWSEEEFLEKINN